MIMSKFCKKIFVYDIIRRYGSIELDSFIKKTINQKKICSN